MKKSINKAVILAVCVAGILLFAGCGWVSRMYYVTQVDPSAAFVDVNIPEAVATPTPQPIQIVNAEVPVTPTPSPEPQIVADMDFLRDRVNILLLGWDESKERNDEANVLYRDEDNNFRSDAILLLSIDFESKDVDMISIPRDTYARIYDTQGKWKINAAFAKGGASTKDGFAYVMNTVSTLFGGIPIEQYVGVNMDGLKRVVDAMGGVNYDVDVKITLNGRVLEKGLQHMDGQQVLDYVRARKGIGTDVDRANRQQKMLAAIFAQLKNEGKILDFIKVYLAVKDYIETNLSVEQIAALLSFANSIDMDNIAMHTLKGKYLNAYDIAFYVLDQNAKVKLAKQIFGVKLKPDLLYDMNFVQKEGEAYEFAKQIKKLLKNGAMTLEQSEVLQSALNEFETFYRSDEKSMDGVKLVCETLQAALDQFTVLAEDALQPLPGEEVAGADELPEGSDAVVPNETEQMDMGEGGTDEVIILE